jgi:ribosomal protein S18 acetylase RimI-like enzyme
MDNMDNIRIKLIIGNNYHKFTYLNKFIDQIYKNFQELAFYPYLKHTRKEIERLLSSNRLVLYLVILDKSIIGYALCEIIQLEEPDRREIIYVSYIYIEPAYRNQKLGSMLMNNIRSYANRVNLDAVILTCDSKNKQVLNFYLKKGYLQDMQLRRFGRYEVFSRIP